MSSKKALIAIARKLLVILWNVLSKQQQYADYTPKIDEKKKQKQIERLEKQLAEIKAA